MKAFCASLLTLWPAISTIAVNAYVGVTFNADDNIYGPDGPWYAIEVQVWSNRDKDAQPQQIHLMPGSTSRRSYIPLSGACGKSACKGGEIETSFITGSPSRIQEDGTTTDNSWNYTINGFDTSFDVSDGANTAAVWPSILSTAYDTSVVKYPSGQNSTLQLGWLSLGGHSPSGQSNSGEDDFTVLGALVTAKAIKSWSYFVHFGSVALNYPAGLMFGGFDRGRVIGPVAKTVAGGFQLQDISIDTETGGSPFPFDNRGALLQDSNGALPSISVYIIVDEPYIYLPSATCEAIADSLPVSFSAGYYLWNTSDPSYERIVTSPAYLGFLFAPSGDSGEITIKVPFRLLNLTLETEASGLPSSVPYLPIQSYDGGETQTYAFGRAFLQAASFIESMDPDVPTTWLAQAPGPGATLQGLGVVPRDIEANDTDLDVYSKPGFFADSWTSHWTPLPMSTAVDTGTRESTTSTPVTSTSSPTTTNPQAQQPQSRSESLNAGTVAGIAIGSSALVVLTACGIAFLFFKQKKNSVKHTAPSGEGSHTPGLAEWFHPELDPSAERGELPGYRDPGELEERRVAREMPEARMTYEMPATPLYRQDKPKLSIDTRKEQVSQ